uniref:RNA helicase n=1 Tax=Ascaris suum TaxID=6253 RepID=F1KWJ6_ASCSU
MEKMPTKGTLRVAQGMGRGAGMRTAIRNLQLTEGELQFGTQAADHFAKSDIAVPTAEMQRRPYVENSMAEIDTHPQNQAVLGQNSAVSKLVDKDVDVSEASKKSISSVQLSDSIYGGRKVFDDFMLKEELLKGLQELHFLMPSKIQELTLSHLLKNPPQNMIAQSQNGTGKTAAFALTMLSRLNPEHKWPQCLCLVPTFELGMQVGETVSLIGRYMPSVGVRLALKGERLMRGEVIEEQVIIGTPGKMLDWVTKFKVIDLSRIVCLVLDEADVMISQQGHRDQSLRLKRELERAGASYQSLLFSATFDDSVTQFANSFVKDAVVITVQREQQALHNVKQYYVMCANRDEKYNAIVSLYGGISIASSIIFCRTKKSVEWLAAKLTGKGHDVVVLHGEMEVSQRAEVINSFAKGEHKVLVTTNVCARGIDIPRVAAVINYDPPVVPTTSAEPEPDYDTYLHRIGRTGRFGRPGIAVNFVSSGLEVDLINRIGRHFEREVELLDVSDMRAVEAIAAVGVDGH